MLRTGQAYELRDPEGMMITVAEGRAIVAERFSVPAEIRNARRRHRADASPGLTGVVASCG